MLGRWRLPGTEPYTWPVFLADFRSGALMVATGLIGGMALGVASGMGAVAGLYCVVVFGFFSALFGGTKAQASGPTAAIAVLVSVVMAKGGATLAEIGVIAAMAGVFQILLGLARIGRFVAYMPHVVLSGFISGVGVILIFSQIQTVLGTDVPGRGVIGTIGALPAAILQANGDDVITAAVTMAVLLSWPRKAGKWLPAPAVALAAATALGAWLLKDAAVIGPLPTGLPVPNLALPSPDFLISAVEPALVIALVGSIYSLIMSITADSITGAQHDPNRELVGQGIGNIAAGILGALPGSASPNTLINLQFGGRTVIAGMVRSAGVLALLLGLGSYAEPIPLAALSVILIWLAWGLIDRRFLFRIREIRREYAAVMLLTLALTLFVDPLTAVVFGLVAAGVAHAARLEGMELDSVVSAPLLDRTFLADDGAEETGAGPFDARVGLLAFRGAFTVASSRKLVRMVGADIRGHEVVIFDFSRTTHIDDSAAQVFAMLLQRAAKERTDVIVLGMSEDLKDVLNSFDVLRHVPEDRIVDELDDARQLAERLLAV